MRAIIFLVILNFPYTTLAVELGNVTGWEIPRYVSIKSDDVNVRVGPSKNYPISIKYIKSNFPVKIIEEYQVWRKVIDFQDHTGWIHESLLIGERNGIIISKNRKNVKIHNTEAGNEIGEISNGTIIRLLKCKTNWCLIKKNNHKGWIKKNFIWGVFEKEEFNISYIQAIYDSYFRSINFINNYLK